MKSFILILLPSLLLLFSSCNKDQEVVTEMEGEWKVVSESFNDIPEDPSTFEGKTYTFERCGVKKRDCTGTVLYAGTPVPFTYSIYDDGKRIKINSNYQGVPPEEEGDILEHSTERLVFRFKDSDGDVTERALERI